MPGNVEEWVTAIGTIVASLWVVVTMITGWTKTPKDDAAVSKARVWLARIFGWSTFSDAGKSLKFPLQNPAPPKE